MAWTPNAPSQQAAAVQQANAIFVNLWTALKQQYAAMLALQAANAGLAAALDADAAANPGRLGSADFAAGLGVAKAWINLVVPGTINDSTHAATITP